MGIEPVYAKPFKPAIQGISVTLAFNRVCLSSLTIKDASHDNKKKITPDLINSYTVFNRY